MKRSQKTRKRENGNMTCGGEETMAQRTARPAGVRTAATHVFQIVGRVHLGEIRLSAHHDVREVLWCLARARHVGEVGFICGAKDHHWAVLERARPASCGKHDCNSGTKPFFIISLFMARRSKAAVLPRAKLGRPSSATAG